MTNLLNALSHFENPISSADFLKTIDTLTPNPEGVLCGLAVATGLLIAGGIALHNWISKGIRRR